MWNISRYSWLDFRPALARVQIFFSGSLSKQQLVRGGPLYFEWGEGGGGVAKLLLLGIYFYSSSPAIFFDLHVPARYFFLRNFETQIKYLINVTNVNAFQTMAPQFHLYGFQSNKVGLAQARFIGWRKINSNLIQGPRKSILSGGERKKYCERVKVSKLGGPGHAPPENWKCI